MRMSLTARSALKLESVNWHLATRADSKRTAAYSALVARTIMSAATSSNTTHGSGVCTHLWPGRAALTCVGSR